MGRKAKLARQLGGHNAVDVGLKGYPFIPERVQVTVRSMDGKSLDFSLAKDRPILSVKKRAAKDWSKHPASLQVSSHGSLLDDSDGIWHYCDEQNRAHFEIIASTVHIHRQLKHENLEMRLDAIEALKVLAESQHANLEPFAEAMCSCLEDEIPMVRQAAVDALSAAISEGDAIVLTEISKRLQNPRPEVRQAAVKALRLVSGQGNGGCVNDLLALLNDPVVAVQLEVVKALGEVPDPGDERVINALIASFDHPQPLMRNSVAESLGRLACQGDAKVMQVLIRRAVAEDNSVLFSQVAETCITSMCKLATCGDENAVQCLLEYISETYTLDGNYVALHALARIARPDDSRVFLVLNAMCENDKRRNVDEPHRKTEAQKALSCFRQRAKQSSPSA